MDTVVRIRPSLGEMPAAHGPLNIAEIELGGIPRGAVLVLCDRGRLSISAEEIMNGLAEHGYESLAADVFPAEQHDPTDADLLDAVSKLVERLRTRGWESDQIGVVGYGFGARVALQAAAHFTLGVAISVNPAGLGHALAPGLTPLADAVEPVTTPWLGMFGAREHATRPADVRRLGKALWAKSPAYTEVVTYRGVTGDFYRNSVSAPAHAAAFDSWQRVIEWLNGHVAPRPTPLAEAWRLHELVG
jgi:carboxymethylenebutenolidase